MALRSFKVIEIGTIRKLGCGFLFAFHSSYDTILYILRDMETFGRKSRNFIRYILSVFSAHAGGDPVGISPRCVMLINYDDWPTVR